MTNKHWTKKIYSHLRASIVCVLFFLCTAGIGAATIKWTGGGGDNQWENGGNWSGNSAPSLTDDVIIDTDGLSLPVAIVTSGAVSIAKILFISPVQKITLTLGGNFTVSDTVDIGLSGTNSDLKHAAHIELSGQYMFKADVLDTNDKANNTVHLADGITLQIKSTIWGETSVGSKTIISGTNAETFIYPSMGLSDGTGIGDGSGSIVINGGLNVKGESAIGGKTFSFSPSPAAGTTVRVTISGVAPIGVLYYKAESSIVSTTTALEINNGAVVWNILTLLPQVTGTSMSIPVAYPSAIAGGEELTISFYDTDGITELGRIVYTEPADYVWTGNISNDWATALNWNKKSVPPSNATVVIRAAAKQPLLAADRSCATLVVEFGAQLDIASFKLTATTITNRGTLLLSGVSDQIKGDAVNGAGSTVEYTGASISSFAWGREYENLVIRGAASIGFPLTVNGTTRIDAKDKTVALTGNNNFVGAVSSDSSKSIIINTSMALQLGNINATTQCEIKTANSSASVTQNSLTQISTVNLLLEGGGSYELTQGNKVTTIAANPVGKLNFKNTTSLTVGAVNMVNGIDSSGDVTIDTGKNVLAIKSDIKSEGSFTQTGSGGVNLHNNISAKDKVSFDSAISVQAASLIKSSGHVLFKNTIAGIVVLSVEGTDIKFDGDVSLSLTINASGILTFNKPVGTTITPIALTVSAAAAVVCESDIYTSRFTDSSSASQFTFSGKNTSFGAGFVQKGSGAVLLKGIITSNASAITFRGPVTLTGATTIDTAGGNLTFSGTVNGTQNLALTAGTGNITFVKEVGGGRELQALTINSAKDISASAITAVSFEQRAGSGAATFSGKVTTTGSGAGIVLSGAVYTINGGLKSASSVTITNSGLLAVNSAISAASGFTQKGSGAVSIAGNIQTASAVISFASPVTLTGNVAFSTGAAEGDIIFSGTVNGTQNLALTAGTGNITFVKEVGGGRELQALTINSAKDISASAITAVSFEQRAGSGAATFSGKVTTTGSGAGIVLSGAVYTINGGLKSASSVTITNSGLLAVNSAISAVSGFTQKGSGAVSLAGNIQTTNAPITFNSDVYITGAAVFNAESAKIDCESNIYISADGENIDIESDIKAKNFILFHGTVLIEKNLETVEDLVLLSGIADTMYKDTQTGIDDIFRYNEQPVPEFKRDGKTAMPSVTEFPTELPSGTAINHALYTGEVRGLGNNPGQSISVGKNLYVNGVSLGTDGTVWTLKLTDNNNSLDAFAEAYNMTVKNSKVVCSTVGGFAWVSACEGGGDGGGNTGWAFSRPQFLVNEAALAVGEENSGTYTIYDDVIRVEFSDDLRKAVKMENSNNEISAAVAHIRLNSGTSACSAFINPECTESTDSKGDLSVFFIKASDKVSWNTDATGNNPGDTASTDSEGTHQTVIPNIYIPKALTTVFATLRDEYKNRIQDYHPSSAYFTGTADRTRPVLFEVRTGQEMHKPFDEQKEYDAHNFLEFRYSEAVEIAAVAENAVNIKSSESLSESTAGGAITLKGSGIQIEGFAAISNGTVKTGSRTENNDTVVRPDPAVHALYRNFSVDGVTDRDHSHAVRLSIGGYVSGTVPSSGRDVNFYPGFITEAVMPSGDVTVLSNAYITDKSASHGDKNKIQPTFNDDPAYGDITITYAKPQVKNYFEDGTVYGHWDISPPVPVRTPWNIDSGIYEILGTDMNEYGYIGQFEFHLLDNTPEYESSKYIWETYEGWNENDISSNIFPDTAGGSRPDYNKERTNNTKGGIRSSSLHNSMRAFTIFDSSGSVSIETVGSYERYTSVLNFFGDTLNISKKDDTLYFSLSIVEKSTFKVRENYKVSYNGDMGFITDLAGNTLQATEKPWITVDRMPPKLVMTVTPLSDNRMFVYFNKKLNLQKENASSKNATLETIHSEFIFREADSNPSDTIEGDVVSDLVATKAELSFITADATGIVLTLSREISFNELISLYITLKSYTLPDPVSKKNIVVSNICDLKGNWMEKDSRAPISHFGINVIEPLYASTGYIQDGLYGEGEGALRLFDGSGRLLFDREITLATKINFTSQESSVPHDLDLFIDVKPVPQSISQIFNQQTGKNIRLWLPTETTPYKVLSTSANIKAQENKQTATDGQISSAFRNFTVALDKPKRKAGDEVEFLFQYGTIKTVEPYTGFLSIDSPFYCMRLSNPADITSLDLFRFSVSETQQQRGGVTVLNNVINSNKREKTVVELTVAQEGSVTVQVLTLDGNVVTILQRGRLLPGTHVYEWDGTNSSGSAVTRGMYFIRVVGLNIDETRKVMVIKE